MHIIAILPILSKCASFAGSLQMDQMRLLPIVTTVCYFWVSIASAQTLDHGHEIPVQRLQRQNKELLHATHALQQQNQRLLMRLEESSYANFAPATVDETQIRDVVSSVLADERRRQAAAGTALPEDAWFEVGQNLDMTAIWRHGVWLESKDKAFRFRVGGRVQHDMV